MHTVAGEAQAIDFQSPWSLLKYTRALTTGELALMPTIKMQVREDTGLWPCFFGENMPGFYFTLSSVFLGH